MGDLRLLGGEDVARVQGAPARGPAGGREFAMGTLGEPVGSDAAEGVVGGPELLASVHAPVLPTKPFAVRAAEVDGDAAAVGDLLRTVDGPVVLVGHSYGGAVISNVADTAEITGLVYVAAFAPEPGEDCNALAGRFPGSTLGDRLRLVPRSDGTADLYITIDRFHGQFCADVPARQAERMGATQRPVTQEALTEPSGEWPLRRGLQSWFLIAEEDRNIPAILQRSWPSAPARAARSRSPARPTRSPSRSLRPRPS
jgi:pimeloyl-ACP methyl ester carboxylesterase